MSSAWFSLWGLFRTRLRFRGGRLAAVACSPEGARGAGAGPAVAMLIMVQGVLSSRIALLRAGKVVGQCQVYT